MVDQIDILCRQLVDPSTEKVKDLSLWLNYLAYDIMGQVVFGRSFDMLTSPSLRYVLSLIDSMVFTTLLVSPSEILTLILKANIQRGGNATTLQERFDRRPVPQGYQHEETIHCVRDVYSG